MARAFTIVGDEIRFADYPIPGASVHPSGVLRAADLRDADPGVRCAPPEVRLHTGETVYLAAGHEPLRRFCVEHGVPLVHRPDVWASLLQPFVDTEFEGYWAERTHAELAGWGFTDEEVAEIRHRFTAVMLAYNAELWDWVHLGLWDLFQALPPDERAPVYGWAMEIAERSRDDAEPLGER